VPNSDQLPGMGGDSVSTVLIIGGVVAAGLLVYYLVKPSSENTGSLKADLNYNSQAGTSEKELNEQSVVFLNHENYLFLTSQR